MFAEGVRAKVYIKGNTISKSGHKYLTLDDLKMDFSVKDIQMGIKNIHNGNTIIGQLIKFYLNVLIKVSKINEILLFYLFNNFEFVSISRTILLTFVNKFAYRIVLRSSNIVYTISYLQKQL